ncbi:GMC family oxidoreductase [Janibacter cremeus]|uniref:GMC family oxidoreductase N-terminal domain-containing protein n=1 Tax=Janibacter cremeus TaxID=1285192 RepID=UPI0023F8CB6D|nr:GMC family oxidoreductase [Janibacter cremeus]WEV79789.1 GMC family oxidoreductase [Janibacter cremeus]
MDTDVLVIGSGFGGSVAALRLSEKGYRVTVLEAGRRFEDEDFAETSWDLKNFLWAPRAGCYGIQRIHMLKDVMILAGAGVGGGSLNYANTLYVPPTVFFEDRQWGHITDWQSELKPHYDMASSMLGVVTNPCEGPVEDVMRAAAADMGVPETFVKTPVGVFFDTEEGAHEQGSTVPDPYFGGAGPSRSTCTECGNCMVGCRVGAKNTLMKNYLALAERLGTQIVPMRTVTRVGIVPGTDAPGREVYRVRHEATDKPGDKGARVTTARHVVVAAGTWGTQNLLHRMKDDGELPRISDTLGALTRTNSEALLGALTERPPTGADDLTKGVAITSSFHPDEDTHIENVRYGKGSDAMGLLTTLLAPPRTGRTPRLAKLLAALPTQLPALKAWFPPGTHFADSTVIGLVMQSLDNSLTTSLRRGVLGGRRLTSQQGHGEKNPTYIESGHKGIRVITERLAERLGMRTFAGGTWSEAFDIPLTAHFLGGAAISDSPDHGVIDPYHRVWGHPGITISDGSAVSANLGVNPSLTITAQAERAFSLWPNAGETDPRPAQGEPYQRLQPVVPGTRAVQEFTHASAKVNLGMPQPAAG